MYFKLVEMRRSPNVLATEIRPRAVEHAGSYTSLASLSSTSLLFSRNEKIANWFIRKAKLETQKILAKLAHGTTNNDLSPDVSAVTRKECEKSLPKNPSDFINRNLNKSSAENSWESSSDSHDEENTDSDSSISSFSSTRVSCNNLSESELESEVKEWAIKNNITLTACTELLHILKQHECFTSLPLDSRTLLTTLVITDVQNIRPGQYVYFGLENEIKRILLNSDIVITSPVKLHVNIDGLPAAKRSSKQFWPIQGFLPEFKNHSQFIIGLYYIAFDTYRLPGLCDSIIGEHQSKIGTNEKLYQKWKSDGRRRSRRC
jgi:hypothetical protein